MTWIFEFIPNWKDREIIRDRISDRQHPGSFITVKELYALAQQLYGHNIVIYHGGKALTSMTARMELTVYVKFEVELIVEQREVTLHTSGKFPPLTVSIYSDGKVDTTLLLNKIAQTTSHSNINFFRVFSKACEINPGDFITLSDTLELRADKSVELSLVVPRDKAHAGEKLKIRLPYILDYKYSEYLLIAIVKKCLDDFGYDYSKGLEVLEWISDEEDPILLTDNISKLNAGIIIADF